MSQASGVPVALPVRDGKESLPHQLPTVLVSQSWAAHAAHSAKEQGSAPETETKRRTRLLLLRSWTSAEHARLLKKGLSSETRGQGTVTDIQGLWSTKMNPVWPGMSQMLPSLWSALTGPSLQLSAGRSSAAGVWNTGGESFTDTHWQLQKQTEKQRFAACEQSST